MASPEASSLGKFGEWPVSEYTGTPNISIPLYKIKVKDIEVPIQLSYHASGIRVDEMASSVGAGWTLNAGGAVTRTIVGLADDDNPYGLMTEYQAGQYIKGSYDLTNVGDYTFFRRVSDQTADVEPDIFYYNFAGASGKFYFDSTGAYHAIPANNLKLLESIFSGATGVKPYYSYWVISDDRGNNYFFGSVDSASGVSMGVERTNSGAAPLRVENARNTAWYLTKIVSADKVDTIYFYYGQKSEQYYLPETQSVDVLTSSPPVSCPTGGSWASYFNSGMLTWNGSTTEGSAENEFQSAGATTLQRIRWRGGEVDFVSNTVRQDMPNNLDASHMLDSVYVKTTNNLLIEAYGLSYSLVQNRYYLDSIRQTSADKSIQLPTKFNYVNRNLLPPGASMSGAVSASQDFWGYNNGAGNTNLLPLDPNMLSADPSLSGVTKANRQPDTVAMQYGTLNKIIYPTGGYTNFVYESNRYNPSTTTTSTPPSTVIITAPVNLTGSTTSPYATITTFSPAIEQSVTITVNVANYGHPISKNMSWLPYLEIYSQNSPGGALTQVYYGDAFDNFPSSGVTANPNGFYNYTYTIPNIVLYAGLTYIMVASDTCLKVTNCVDLQTPMPNISASLQYQTYQTVSGGGGSGPLPIAGGLRIKGIYNYDQANNLQKSKVFSYGAGQLLVYPYYDKRWERDVAWDASQSGAGNPPAGSSNPDPTQFFSVLPADFVQEFSTSQAILGVTQGSTVGYPQVTETDIDGNGIDDGYTNYTFSFTGDTANALSFDTHYSPWVNMQIVGATVPFNDFDFKRGLLLNKDVYKRNADNSYAKIHSEINTYNFNDFNPANRYARIRGVRLLRLRTIDGPSGQYNLGNLEDGYIIPTEGNGETPYSPDYAYAIYDIVSGWVQKSSTTEINYDQNGLNPLVSTTSYYYDNPLHMNVTRTSMNKSDGSTVTTLTTYPQDYASGTSFIDSLVTHYCISDPIETVRYQTDPSSNVTVLGGKIMTYLPDGKGLPNAVELLETSAPVALGQFKFSNVSGLGTLPYNASKTSLTADTRYVTRANFSSYDGYKNIAQDALSSDLSQAYLWDYSGVYPIASAKNAAQSDIAYTSFEADGSGNWTIPDTSRGRTAFLTGNLSYILTGSNAIGRASLNSGTAYIVGYWGLSGNAITVNGSAGSPKITIGSWTYYEAQVTGTTTIAVSGTGTIDELRLYPKGALMTTYTYAPLIGMTTQCDPSGKLTFYTYDGLGRLKLIKDQYGNILKRYDYEYQTSNQ
jgi:hypothetical protein